MRKLKWVDTNKLKHCKSCNTEKDLASFHSCSSITPAGNNTIKYAAKCIDCTKSHRKIIRANNPISLREYAKQWNLEHKNHVIERKAAWLSQPGVKDRQNELLRNRRSTDQGKRKLVTYRESYKPTAWYKQAKALGQRTRRARLRADTDNKDPRISMLYLEAIMLERKLAACVACDDELDIKIHVDHIKPLKHGGLHVFENLQLLSARENVMKGAKYQPIEK